MKKRFLSIIALCLAVSLVFSGCQLFKDLMEQAMRGSTAFDDMEYTRPNVSNMKDLVDESLKLSATADDVDVLMEPVLEFYALYADFTTNYYLAYIHYSIDMSDSYWDEEYTHCSEQLALVQSLTDELLYGLAACDLREELESTDFFGAGFFDDYQGESLWTERFTQLMEQETALQNEYYDLVSQANSVTMFSEEYFEQYGSKMGEVFVEMIALRQQIAAEAGYEDYPSFAYDFYFDRDYSPKDVADYLDDIQKQIAPLYRQVLSSDSWYDALCYSSTQETFHYVEEMANKMGGTIKDAFKHLDSLDLYHIKPGDDKLSASFEVWLPNYMSPFIFMDPDGSNQDQLTFAHEFGHFCSDYANFGSGVGIDVAEIFSQGMEYLSLTYAPHGEDNETLKMVNSLCVFAEQSAFASFELAVYGLEGDELTVENVLELFSQSADAFGLDAVDMDPRRYVAVTHFFTSPLYVISYVVSNDVAMQLYQLESEDKGAGLERYKNCLTTTEAQLMGFLKSAGLESPFGRAADIRKAFEDALI